MGRKKTIPVALLNEVATDEMKRAIENKVRSLITKASKKHKGISFVFPAQIRYNISSDLDGDYNYEKNWMRINPVLYFENPTFYLEAVVVRLTARLISKQRTKGKCKPHGKEWDEDVQMLRGKQVHAKVTTVKTKLTKVEEVIEDMDFLLARVRRLKFKNFSEQEKCHDALYVMYEDTLRFLHGEKVTR